MTNNPNAFVSVPREPTEEMIRIGVLSMEPRAPYQHFAVENVYRRMIAAAPSAPVVSGEEWLPIETAPKDGTSILACCGRVANGFYAVVFFDDEAEDELRPWGVDDSDLHYHREFFTHWRQLPAAPNLPEGEK